MGAVSRLAPIISGTESKTYRFQTSSGRYIVRFNRIAAGFAKDAFTRSHFASPSLPIPEIVERGDDANGVFYCISREMQGATLQDLAPCELPLVLAPTAAVMRQIARADLSGTTGYGPFDSRGAGAHASWREFLLSAVNLDSCPAERSLIESVQRRVVELAEDAPENRHLVHGDFGSNNVLTDGAGITAVLDWSDALFGDPLYDIANIFFWRSWLDCMEQQAQYIEREVTFAPLQKRHLLCYQLRIGLIELSALTSGGSTKLEKWLTTRCENLLKHGAY